MTEPSREEQVRRAQVIDGFFKDPVIADVMSKLERFDYERFLKASTSEERAKAQGIALAHREFEDSVRALLSAGERAMLELANDVKKEQSTRGKP
jgi:carbamoylphosphate synthase large subunit